MSSLALVEEQLAIQQEDVNSEATSKQPILGVVLLDGEIAKCELQSRLKTLLTTWRGAWILFFVRVNKQPILGVVLLGAK